MAKITKTVLTHGYRLALTRRVVHLIKLFEAGERLSQSELAFAFGVHQRTVRRYVRALQEFYPIHRIQEGRNVSYVLERKK